jgi:hypothetical protein
MTLDQLQHSDFAPLLGQTFAVWQGGASLAFTLSSASILGHRRTGATREPFAITFCGASGLRLPQGIYLFQNETLGELEFFITQLGDGPRGAEFEAVFT